jgi:hypothetical protein
MLRRSRSDLNSDAPVTGPSVDGSWFRRVDGVKSVCYITLILPGRYVSSGAGF